MKKTKPRKITFKIPGDKPNPETQKWINHYTQKGVKVEVQPNTYTGNRNMIDNILRCAKHG